jgi:catechol 2,3-dioxygenase-like lactoylglutathione lyase family enzyme
MTLTESKIVAFLATTVPDRSLSFYRDVIGLPLVNDDQFALVFDANGTHLRIQKVQNFQPQPFTALGWAVSDISAAVSELEKRGVKFERYSFIEQNAAGVWTSPSGAKVAWFKDPDENLLSITEYGI